MTHAHTPLSATAPLWAQIATLFDLFVRAFGGVAQLMAARTLARRDARDASRWLSDIEATVRRLLFAEASTVTLKPMRARASVAPPPKAPVKMSIPHNPLAYREMILDGPPLLRIGARAADEPANWKVSFKLGAESGDAQDTQNASTEDAIAGLSGCAPEDVQCVSARPLHLPVDRLARRLEAVRRVIADPAPWVRRLARKLQRRPQLAARLARPPRRRWRTPCGAALPMACAVIDVALHKRE